MRRASIATLVVALLCCGVVALAESPDSSNVAKQSDPKTVTCGDKVIDVEKALDDYVEGLEADAVGVPPCPAIQTCQTGTFECGGNNSCGANLQVRDLGWKACDTLTCGPHQTVHILWGVCGYCPCCSTTPACLCPGPGIGCGERAVADVYCE